MPGPAALSFLNIHWYGAVLTGVMVGSLGVASSETSCAPTGELGEAEALAEALVETEAEAEVEAEVEAESEGVEDAESVLVALGSYTSTPSV